MDNNNNTEDMEGKENAKQTSTPTQLTNTSIVKQRMALNESQTKQKLLRYTGYIWSPQILKETLEGIQLFRNQSRSQASLNSFDAMKNEGVIYGVDDAFNAVLDSQIDEMFSGKKKRMIFMASEMGLIRSTISKDVNTATKQIKEKRLTDTILTPASTRKQQQLFSEVKLHMNSHYKTITDLQSKIAKEEAALNDNIKKAFVHFLEEIEGNGTHTILSDRDLRKLVIHHQEMQRDIQLKALKDSSHKIKAQIPTVPPRDTTPAVKTQSKDQHQNSLLGKRKQPDNHNDTVSVEEIKSMLMMEDNTNDKEGCSPGYTKENVLLSQEFGNDKTATTKGERKQRDNSTLKVLPELNITVDALMDILEKAKGS